jgi:hypothetical protein
LFGAARNKLRTDLLDLLPHWILILAILAVHQVYCTFGPRSNGSAEELTSSLTGYSLMAILAVHQVNNCLEDLLI